MKHRSYFGGPHAAGPPLGASERWPLAAPFASTATKNCARSRGGTMKNTTLRRLAGVAVIATVSSVASAQQPPAAPAPVPEQMPFDIPYGTPVGLEQAKQLPAPPQTAPNTHNWKMPIP